MPFFFSFFFFSLTFLSQHLAHRTMITSSSNSTEVKDTIDILHEIATLLNTKLDKETLALCISLCEKGVNPEALSVVIKDLQKQASSQPNSPQVPQI
ncbi:mitotic-spindle organizing gamma-tubulin ring associated-domain-containing protein [Gongronella butleri]|nr:mitotic-spindle organizing gamma-tubulin ring associated-domain-containing protein [Gongronella butleri]